MINCYIKASFCGVLFFLPHVFVIYINQNTQIASHSHPGTSPLGLTSTASCFPCDVCPIQSETTTYQRVFLRLTPCHLAALTQKNHKQLNSVALSQELISARSERSFSNHVFLRWWLHKSTAFCVKSIRNTLTQTQKPPNPAALRRVPSKWQTFLQIARC